MDDIHEWLEDHCDQLAQIARETGVGPGVVHLLAVLVLGGLHDEQILGELRAHLVYRDGADDPLRHVPEAMSVIRDLAGAAS